MKRKTRRRIRRIFFILLVAGVLTTAAFYGWKAGGTNDVLSKLESPDGDKEFFAKASDCLRKFWKERDCESKLAFVHNPKLVSERMRDYYLMQNHREPKVTGLQSQGFRTIGSTRVYYAGFITEGPPRLMEAFMFQEPNGSVRLDWEAYEGVGEMEWADFIMARRETSTLMRGLLSPSRYYNYEFEDSKRFEAFRFECPDGVTFLNAYCERGTETYVKLLAMMFRNDGRKTRVTLKVAFPEHAKSKNCVRIDKLVAEGWLVLE